MPRTEARATEEARPKDLGNLPDISVFQSHPSDRFLVDLDDFTSGHPFKGVNSVQPHAGAHINFDNSDNRWPKGGKEPANYPAIYAVADGVISRVDFRFGQTRRQRPIWPGSDICSGRQGERVPPLLLH